MDASQRSIRVEVQATDGTPLPGYALEDCLPLEADGTALTISWRSGQALGNLAGRPVRLKVEIRNARLFAFQFP